MTTLYAITESLAALREQLEASEGELTPEMEAALFEGDAAFDAKAERVALFIREQMATAAAVLAEESRLSQRGHALTQSAANLKAYLQRQLEAAGKTRVEGTLCTVAIQQNPPSVVIPAGANPFFWPNEFVRRIPESYEPDKKALLAAHALKQPLPPGVEISRSSSIRIR